MKVKVIYPEGNLTNERKIYDLDVPHDPTDEHSEILETVFRYMNRVDGSEIEDQLNTFEARSMSVGDYCQIGNTVYLCDDVGWIEVSPAIAAEG